MLQFPTEIQKKKLHSGRRIVSIYKLRRKGRVNGTSHTQYRWHFRIFKYRSKLFCKLNLDRCPIGITMSKLMKLEMYQVNAFASHFSEGNPAGVIELSEFLDDDVMIAIAK